MFKADSCTIMWDWVAASIEIPAHLCEPLSVCLTTCWVFPLWHGLLSELPPLG